MLHDDWDMSSPAFPDLSTMHDCRQHLLQQMWLLTSKVILCGPSLTFWPLWMESLTKSQRQLPALSMPRILASKNFRNRDQFKRFNSGLQRCRASAETNFEFDIASSYVSALFNDQLGSTKSMTWAAMTVWILILRLQLVFHCILVCDSSWLLDPDIVNRTHQFSAVDFVHLIWLFLAQNCVQIYTLKRACLVEVGLLFTTKAKQIQHVATLWWTTLSHNSHATWQMHMPAHRRHTQIYKERIRDKNYN